MHCEVCDSSCVCWCKGCSPRWGTNEMVFHITSFSWGLDCSMTRLGFLNPKYATDVAQASGLLSWEWISLSNKPNQAYVYAVSLWKKLYLWLSVWASVWPCTPFSPVCIIVFLVPPHCPGPRGPWGKSCPQTGSSARLGTCRVLPSLWSLLAGFEL